MAMAMAWHDIMASRRRGRGRGRKRREKEGEGGRRRERGKMGVKVVSAEAARHAATALVPPLAAISAASNASVSGASVSSASVSSASGIGVCSTKRKGDAGRVGIVGGSAEYTGAPFFAAMAAYRAGADLVHVFCPPRAASVIKSYSPDLIVHPCVMDLSARHPSNLADETRTKDREKISENHQAHPSCSPTNASVSADEEPLNDTWDTDWLPRMSAIVVGPGLGRGSAASAAVKRSIEIAKAYEIPIVLDADALYTLSRDPLIIMGYKKAVLTPNHHEFKRLVAASKQLNSSSTGDGESDGLDGVVELSHAFLGPTIVRKDAVDSISDGNLFVKCDEAGCPRRCGGQGDVLAGSAAVFASWLYTPDNEQKNANEVQDDHCTRSLVTACYGASLLTRHTAAAAFAKHKRSMTASDVVAEVGDTFEKLFPIKPTHCI